MMERQTSAELNGRMSMRLCCVLIKKVKITKLENEGENIAFKT